MRVSQGSSLHALNRLARSKNYRLIHATHMNGIFVDEKYFEIFGIAENDPAQLRAVTSSITQIFQTFDGRIHLVGNRKLFWHEGLSMSERRMQPLPRILQCSYAHYNFFQKCAWKAYRLWTLLTRGKDENRRYARRWACEICSASIDKSAGVTPSNRNAWPNVRGRCFVQFFNRLTRQSAH